MGRPRRHVGHPPDGILAYGREEPPGDAGGDRIRGRQAQPGARRFVLPQLRRAGLGRPRSLLRQELPLLPDGQLGGGERELDGRHDRPVPRAPRLRSDAVPSRAHRPRGGERGRERSVPVGFPPHDRGPLGREPLRRRHRVPPPARDRPLRGGDGLQPSHDRGRPREQGTRRHPDGRVLGAAARTEGQPRAPGGRAGGRLRRAHLRQDARGHGVLHVHAHGAGMGPVARGSQADRGQVPGPGRQPHRLPHLRPPAVRGRRPQARAHPGTLRPR